eukprot:scaffold1106_cov126-Cylindrotheca_fusiformis.AAC.12
MISNCKTGDEEREQSNLEYYHLHSRDDDGDTAFETMGDINRGFGTTATKRYGKDDCWIFGWPKSKSTKIE